MVTIDALIEGDDATLALLYESNKQQFLLFSGKYNIDNEEAIDIYQDAIIALIELARKGKLQQLKSTISTYLFAIGKYMIFKKKKLLSNTIALENFDNLLIEWDTYDIEKDKKEILELQKHYQQLGKVCKDILYLFYYKSYKLPQICELLAYENTDVVKSQKSRCLKKLKQLMKQ